MKCPTCQNELTKIGKFWVCAEHGQVVQGTDVSTGNRVSTSQNVFISYGRTDGMEFVERLASDLTHRGGHQVWFDLQNVGKGGLFEVQIERGIRECTIFAAVMSKRSLAEDSVCRDEVVYALNEGKPIVPLRIDADSEAKPSLLLARRNWIDFTDDYEKALELLLRYLAGDQSALVSPRLRTVSGVAPLDFSIEIARFYSGFAGREWLGTLIDKWLEDSSKRVLVIVGEPGVGKSSAAAWLSQTRKDVVGIHFCTQQNTRSRDPHEFVACLVGQLCARLPGFADAVELNRPHIRRATASNAFRELIIEPANKLAEMSTRRLIVIDSLDEAATVSGESIVDVLIRQTPDLPRWLRIVTTTRPEEPILARSGNLNVLELSGSREENRDDLRRFIVARLNVEPLAKIVLDKETTGVRIETLADGNFLYAGLVLDALQDKSLTVGDLGRLTPGLSVFYGELFRRRFPERSKYAPEIATLTKALTVAREPLSFDLLVRISGVAPEVLNAHLLDLRAYLRVVGRGDSSTYSLYHKTLAEWLSDREVAGQYWCDPKTGHRDLANALWGHWQEDEYALRHLPAHLTGSCDWDRLTKLLCELDFLEAKVKAGLVFDLAFDFHTAVASLPTDHPHRKTIQLIEEALYRDIHFIARHVEDYPQSLFQCLWNKCWWYDSPEAAQHYRNPNDECRVEYPWQQSGPKLYQLVESWREEFESFPNRIWLRSMRPPPFPLGGVLSANLHGHRGKVRSISVAQDDCNILTAGDDSSIRIWNLRNSQETLRLNGHTSGVSTTAYSPDEQRILTVGSDNTVRTWNAHNGIERSRLLIAGDAVATGRFSPDGRLVACGTSRGDISVYELDSEQLRISVHDHEDAVLSLAWLAEDLIVSASSDKTIRLWDLSRQQQLRSIVAHDAEVFAIEVLPGLNQFISVGADNTLRLWDSANGTELNCIKNDAPIFCVAASPDGKLIASGTVDGRVWVWDVRTMSRRHSIGCGGGAVVSIVFMSDGRRIVTGTWDGTVKIWDTSCAEKQLVLRGHGEDAKLVSFSPDGQRVASITNSAILRIWDVKSGREVANTHCKEITVRELGYSDDGRRIIVRGNDGSLVCDAETGSLFQTTPGVNDIIGESQRTTAADWRVLTSRQETVVESIRTGRPQAWLTETIDGLKAHPSDRSWAGIAQGHLYMFALEGKSLQ